MRRRDASSAPLAQFRLMLPALSAVGPRPLHVLVMPARHAGLQCGVEQPECLQKPFSGQLESRDLLQPVLESGVDDVLVRSFVVAAQLRPGVHHLHAPVEGLPEIVLDADGSLQGCGGVRQRRIHGRAAVPTTGRGPIDGVVVRVLCGVDRRHVVSPQYWLWFQ